MNLHINSFGQGQPLVFFHGWGFDQSIWHDLIEDLQYKYCVYLVDLPGFGQSDMMDWVQFKSILLQHLPQQFALTGWSLGGLFATRLAIEEPLRITHLMNVTSSPYFIKLAGWPGIDKSVLTHFFNQLLQKPQQTTAEFIALQLQHKELNLKAFKATQEGLTAGLETLAQWDLRASLKQLTMPVCYLFGRLDAIVPRTTLGVMQENYPDFHYILLHKAAHVPFLTHTKAFITELTQFMV